MAFGKIKRQFLVNKFHKELKSIPETRTPNSKKIHSVAILTTHHLNDELDIAEKITSNIESVRNVHIYSFRPYKKSDDTNYKNFTEKDFDWKGKVIDASFDSFLENNQFDLMIGYFNEKQLYLEYAVLKSKADFKIGFANVNDKIFDLVVSEEPLEIDSFIKVIKKYLKVLNKI